MANDLSGRPWIIDTFSAVNPVKPGPPAGSQGGVGGTFTTGFVFRDYTGGAASLASIIDLGRGGLVVAKIPGNAAGTPVGEAYYHPQRILNMAINADSGRVEVIIK